MTLYNYQWYQNLYERIPAIREDARQAAQDLGLDKMKGEIGVYAGSSTCPGNLSGLALDAIVAANTGTPVRVIDIEDELRQTVKDMYGDEYDCAVANSCEAALRICMEILFAPPTMRKGDAYRGRVIAPYSENFEFFAGYGRAFPPKYKNLASDRSLNAGELAVEGKSLTNLDSVFVRFAGARYEVHGIRQNLVPFLTRADAAQTLKKIKLVSERHAASLVGFASIGYDTPGYGFGAHDDDGTPTLMRNIAELAGFYDLPYLLDCAGCLPGIGLTPGQTGADIMTWSMDKVARVPTSGLIIGKNEAMVQVRKGLGLGGHQFGHGRSHGKALYSMSDPGRDALVGVNAFMKDMRDNPQSYKEPIDQFHNLIVEALQDLDTGIHDKLAVTKSYHLGGTEINYVNTWDDGPGIPIFTMEDLFANVNTISLAMDEMGIGPGVIYGGNIFLGPGMGTLDRDGVLNLERASLAAWGFVKALEITCRHAGLMD